MNKRILFCEFHQESNTFNPQIWDIDRFGVNRNFEGHDPLHPDRRI